MKTPLHKHRTYCKTCENFTIHNSEYICETCNTEFTSYFPNEVKKELVLEQRARYKKQKLDKFENIYNKFMLGSGLRYIVELQDKFNEVFPKADIIECDAGQKAIDDREKQLKEKEQQRIQLIKEEYETNYKHLGRNNKCGCGSGKKFKQCHLIEFKKDIKI